MKHKSNASEGEFDIMQCMTNEQGKLGKVTAPTLLVCHLSFFFTVNTVHHIAKKKANGNLKTHYCVFNLVWFVFNPKTSFFTSKYYKTLPEFCLRSLASP